MFFLSENVAVKNAGNVRITPSKCAELERRRAVGRWIQPLSACRVRLTIELSDPSDPRKCIAPQAR